MKRQIVVCDDDNSLKQLYKQLRKKYSSAKCVKRNHTIYSTDLYIKLVTRRYYLNYILILDKQIVIFESHFRKLEKLDV